MTDDATEKPGGGRTAAAERKAWTFVTSHALVLLCIASDPNIRLREVAERVGITERAVQRIVADLEEAGYVTHERIGRRNRYTLLENTPMRHPMVRDHAVRDLVRLLGPIG